jgi:Flp pilus assembly protein TadD
LARGYAKLGDSKRLEEFREKFVKSIADSSRMSSWLIKAVGVRTEAVLLAAKGQWTEADVRFEKCFELMKRAMAGVLHEAMARTDYAWALRKQEKFAEARTQIEEAKKLYRKLGNKSNIERLDVVLR